MIVLVNGIPAETGCHLDGVRGWRAIAAVALEVAPAFGYDLDPADGQHLERWLDGEVPDSYEVHEIADEATDWLNEHTPEGWVWQWNDGDFGLYPVDAD